MAINATEVAGIAVVNPAGLTRFDVTAYARYRRTRYKELIAYRAVRGVTNGTAFAHRFVLEDKRASLFFVAFEAFFILAQQTSTQ